MAGLEHAECMYRACMLSIAHTMETFVDALLLASANIPVPLSMSALLHALVHTLRMQRARMLWCTLNAHNVQHACTVHK
jgi:hypothetical protein